MGPFRHYWVLIKLVLNTLTTAVLLLYLRSIADAADLARQPVVTGAEPPELRDPTHAVHAAAAIVVLLLATVLAVYKPRGLTRYGQRESDHTSWSRRSRPAGQPVVSFDSQLKGSDSDSYSRCSRTDVRSAPAGAKNQPTHGTHGWS